MSWRRRNKRCWLRWCLRLLCHRAGTGPGPGESDALRAELPWSTGRAGANGTAPEPERPWARPPDGPRWDRSVLPRATAGTCRTRTGSLRWEEALLRALMTGLYRHSPARQQRDLQPQSLGQIARSFQGSASRCARADPALLFPAMTWCTMATPTSCARRGPWAIT